MHAGMTANPLLVLGLLKVKWLCHRSLHNHSLIDFNEMTQIFEHSRDAQE